jgi:hypothetical protein
MAKASNPSCNMFQILLSAPGGMMFGMSIDYSSDFTYSLMSFEIKVCKIGFAAIDLNLRRQICSKIIPQTHRFIGLKSFVNRIKFQQRGMFSF